MSSVDYQRDSLAEITLKQAEELARTGDETASLRGALERYDEGLAAVEWVLSREIGRGNAKMDAEKFLRVLGEVCAYGGVGIRPWWLDPVMASMRKADG